MDCPPQFRDLVLDLIRIGLLRIREFGWEGDAARCAIEADHIHNLPVVLREFSHDLLVFYWERERPAFLQQSALVSVEEFEAPWARLGQLLGLGDRRDEEHRRGD